jgi:aspartyl/asparaginyl-tRNA synthetase
MDFYNIDKEIIKDAINEMVESNPQIFKEAIDKVLDKKQQNIATPNEEMKEVDRIIDKHFEKYDAVFRALA